MWILFILGPLFHFRNMKRLPPMGFTASQGSEVIKNCGVSTIQGRSPIGLLFTNFWPWSVIIHHIETTIFCALSIMFYDPNWISDPFQPKWLQMNCAKSPNVVDIFHDPSWNFHCIPRKCQVWCIRVICVLTSNKIRYLQYTLLRQINELHNSHFLTTHLRNWLGFHD